MVYIYVLQLEHGKYYIGKTNNPRFRLKNHFMSNGSQWTKIYKPLKLVELKPNCDDYDEDKITRQYMDKYGIDNVRGGSFTSVKLDKSTLDVLKQMSNGTNNKCFICGKEGHFAKDCWEKNESGKDFAEERKCKYHKKYYNSKKFSDCCFRCGRENHYASSCYASTHIDGYYIDGFY